MRPCDGTDRARVAHPTRTPGLLRRFATLLLVASFASACAAAQAQPDQSGAAPAPRRVLTASLYPYIPDAGSAYFAIEEAFERAHPEIDLRIHLLSETYYDHRPDRRNILRDEADVYEIDSVFLADFVAAGKIAPLGSDLEQLAAGTVPFTRAVATRDGHVYGLPHWMCGNFLLYRAGDKAVEAARTLADIERALDSSTAEPRWLIADFSGRSTLGEMYLDAAMDASGKAETALHKVMAPGLDQSLVRAMTRAVSIVRPGFGRDEDYHNRTGFYARQFARGAGRAYVGYSEQLYYALSETALSCRKDEGCLTAEQIKVAEWPLADSGSRPIAWVDMLVIDRGANGQKRRDAESFIRFMAQPSTYRLFLMPAWPNPPRYLLPARDDMYADPDLIAAAPLYTQFRERISGATPITATGLNRRLREAGTQLEEALPPR